MRKHIEPGYRFHRGIRVCATCHLAKASVLMMQAIQRERPDAIFVNSESSEFYQPCCADNEIRRIADFENQRRFIALDLLYGIPVRSDVYAYLLARVRRRRKAETQKQSARSFCAGPSGLADSDAGVDERLGCLVAGTRGHGVGAIRTTRHA